jgi:hypothetical protein
VVEVALAGLRVVLTSVVEVVVCVDGSLVSFTVVQADSDTKTAAARQGMMSFFIIRMVVWMVAFLRWILE